MQKNKIKDLISFPIFLMVYCLGLIFLAKHLSIGIFAIEIFMMSFIVIFYVIIDLNMTKKI